MSHELDAAVAVEVMGEPEPPKIPEDAERAVVSAYLAGDVSLSDGGNWWLSCVYDDGDIPTWKPLPFSGNVADAWMVVKKLVDPDNYEFVLASDSYGDRLVFKAGFHGLIDDVECHGHEAPTAPEAICLAALEAVRAEP